MKMISFEEPKKYVPNISVIPAVWEAVSFENLDFTKKEGLQDVLLKYFESFSINGHDSIIFCGGDFVYRLLVAIYKEVGARITLDTYRFINWAEYIAMIKGLGYKGDKQLMDDIFGIGFLFIFDLSIQDQDQYFAKLLDYAYINRIHIFICTRMPRELVENYLSETVLKMYKDKMIIIGVSDGRD